MTSANARIRWQIADDQLFHEVESTLVLMGKQPDYKPNLPTQRMIFWDGEMRKQLAEGWAARTR